MCVLETRDLLDGIKAGLGERLTKFSERVQRNVEFDKTAAITVHPPFLVVNFVRFFWKAREQVKAKILKVRDILVSLVPSLRQKVKFPVVLDIASLMADPADEGPVGYDLVSVITHIGRSADSGHYISWTKNTRTSMWDGADQSHLHRLVVEV